MTSDIRDWTGVSGRTVRTPQTTGTGQHVCPQCHDPVDTTPEPHEISTRYLLDPGTRDHVTRDDDRVDILARWCASCDIVLPVELTSDTPQTDPNYQPLWVMPDRAQTALQTPARADQIQDPAHPSPRDPPVIVHTSEPHDIDISRGTNGESLAHAAVGEPGWLGNPTLSVRNGGNWPHEMAVSLYFHAFIERFETDPEFNNAVADLTGKRLACTCRYSHQDTPRCHGDIIRDVVARITQ